MQICVLKEKREYENRVAATPETVKKMVAAGHKVTVEKGAGNNSSFSDQAYQDAGAKIASDVAEAVKGADVILKVRQPIAAEEGEDEFSQIPEGAVLIGTLDSLTDLDQIKSYKEKKIKAFALERVPRITRAQSMDVLSSQSNL